MYKDHLALIAHTYALLSLQLVKPQPMKNVTPTKRKTKCLTVY